MAKIVQGISRYTMKSEMAATDFSPDGFGL
jgi:hypothetical protein